MGGRGASAAFRHKSEKRRLSFASGKKGKPSKQLFPALLNLLKNTGSLEKMSSGFEKLHGGEGKEFGAMIDPSGYATKYYEGTSDHVAFHGSDARRSHFLHNHPADGWGHFSGADLMTFASNSGLTGISAISRNAHNPKPHAIPERTYANRRAGTYRITKTHHFKYAEFQQAIRGIQLRSDHYDEDLHRWLSANQRKYGYKYSYRKARNKLQ